MGRFYTPSDLSVTPDRIARVMLLGGCIFDRWRDVLARKYPGIAVDHAPFDYSGALNGTGEKCDFRLVQIPLRYLYPEVITMQTRHDDLATYDEALARAFRMMRRVIDKLDGASRDRPTFFLNYPLPQLSRRSIRI